MRYFRMSRLLASIFAAALLFTSAPLAVQAQDDDASKAKVANKVPVMVLSGPIMERTDPLALFGSEGTTLRGLKEKVRQAAADEDVAAVVLRFESPGWNLAQAIEFHDVLLEFKDSGKPLYASFDSAGLGVYPIATAADEIVIPPVGGLDLVGMNAAMFYFKDMLGKLGIQADGVNTGKFKDAFDPFIRDSMGEGTRIQITELMNDLFGTLVQEVAQNRGISEDEAFEILTLGPYTSDKALEIGAVDRVQYLSEFYADLEEEFGTELEFVEGYGKKEKKEKPNFMALFMGGMGGKSEKSDDEPKIAVVYAMGQIIDGSVDKSNPFASQEVIASEDFLDLLDEVVEEEGLEAVVLRVDSPGGSAIASDRIWHRIEEIQADGLPVVVSMGSVAASGGYYISMGADKIYADPTTITGSIGVVGGKFAFGGTYEKIGVTRQAITIGDHAGFFNEAEVWNDEQKEILNDLLDDVYDTFTSKAAEGRGMTQDRIKELGGGRVWSGVDAADLGLIDELGGLDDAVAYARELANAPEAKVVEFPKEKDLMELLEEALMISASTNYGVASQIRGSAVFQAASLVIPEKHLNHLLFMVTSLQDKPGVMLVMPYSFEITY